MWYYAWVQYKMLRHHSNNMTVTITNADTSAKYNTVVHDNICGTKCNNNDSSYPGNGAKCGTIVVTVLFLRSYPGNVVKCVSREFINPLCPRWVWKIHRGGMTQFIQNFFQRLGWFAQTKLLVCWQLKDT